MSNPNPEVYGAPSTWITNYYLGGTTIDGAENMKCSRSKVAVWNITNPSWTYGRTQLRSAVNDGKITANELIDKSICPCGQDSSVSHLGSIGVLVNRKHTEFPEDTEMMLVTTINVPLATNNKPINWCFFESDRPTGATAGYALEYPYKLRMTPSIYNYTIWAPDSDYDPDSSSKINGNYYIAPLVEYQSRTILLRIEVGYINTVYSDGQPNQINWVTLEEWKNSYSDKSITAARLTMYRATNISISSIQYSRSSSQARVGGGAAWLDWIPVGTTSYDIKPSFAWYGLMGSYQFPAVLLFEPKYSLNTKDSNEYEYVFMPCWSDFASYHHSTHRGVNNTSEGWSWYEIPYSESVYKRLMEIAALFGCPFTPTSTLTFSTSFTDSDLCLPIIDDNGITHGEYTRGTDNTNNPFINLDSVRDKDYKPDGEVDPNTYNNTTGFNSLSGGASATQRYVLNDSNVRQLLSDLWTITHTIAGVDYDKFDYKILDSFLVTDPINSIVSLKRFPFDIPHTFSPAKTNVNLGKNQGTAQGYLTYNVFNSIQFSGIDIYPKFGRSFLDFAPYTEYELYVPFCGTIKLNAGEILDRTLSVRMSIDLITGVCVAYIMADSLCIETLTGSVSSDMQISGVDAATADGAIQNAVINHISARTNKEVADFSPMSLSGLMSSVTNPFKVSGSITEANTALTKADYDITHINTPIHSMGSAGGLSSWIQEFNCRLIIYYPEGEAIDSSGGVSQTSPKLADLTSYAHTTGFACVMNGQVSNYHGLTVGNIDTSSIVGASEEERNMIKTLFSQGVWLP